MRTPAEIAIDNVLVFDVKKDGLQQRQNGDWVLRVTIAELDIKQVIVNAKMGTIFQCTLVEKGDDEMPVDHKAKERAKWRDHGATKQAGMRCSDPVFWAWLEEELKYTNVNTQERAAVIVRSICGVTSRSEFDKPGNSEARVKWHQLDNAFQGWKAAEHG